MDHEPQTMSEDDMNKRLELFAREFKLVAESMDVISIRTERILQELDLRISAALKNVESEPMELRPKEA